MTKAEFGKCMAVLSAGTSRPLPADTLDVWYGLLSHLAVDVLQRAVAEFLRNDGEFPSVAKLLRLAETGPSAEDRAAISLSAVRSAVVRHGRYAAVHFDDATTNAAVRDLGGWPAVCSLDLDEPWTAKRFRDAYGVRLRNGFPEEQARALIGEFGRPTTPARIAVGLPPLPTAAAPRIGEAGPAVRLLAESLSIPDHPAGEPRRTRTPTGGARS